MLLSDMQHAVIAAEHELKRVDHMALEMATLLLGRLRAVNRINSHYNKDILRALKRELQSFNSHTGKWTN